MALVGRDPDRLGRVAADLAVRRPGAEVATHVVPRHDAGAIRAAVDALAAAGPIDLALVAFGSLPDQAACQDDLEAAEAALAVNGVEPALWAEALAGAMVPAGRGTLVVIGSVAGDRGRKSTTSTAPPRAWSRATSRACSIASPGPTCASSWSSRGRPTRR